VLLALSRQSLLPARVVVADDGSGPATAAMIGRVAARLPFPVTHVWQPDDGFRLARSRNNALREIGGGLVAVLDQDMLPHREWLQIHANSVPPGCGGIGNSIDLTPETAAAISTDDAAAGGFELMRDPSELRRLTRLQRRCLFYAFLRGLGLGVRAKPKLRGNNMSAHLADLAAVNGFDEEYVGWGQEDDDLGRRLYLSGIRPVVLVSRAVAFHMGHAPRSAGAWRNGPNVARFHRTDLPVRCARGMDTPRTDVVVTHHVAAAGEPGFGS